MRHSIATGYPRAMRTLILLGFGCSLLAQQPAAAPSQPQSPARNATRGSSETASGPDWWMIVLTAGLVAVGGIQAWILRRQTRLINESLAETRVATQLTRESLVLSQRPKLIVRNFSLYNEEGILLTRNGKPARDPMAPTGTLRVVNVGGSTARVTAWQCQVIVARQLPTRPPLPLLTDQLQTPVTLRSGVYGTMPFPTTRQNDITVDELLGIYKQELNLYVIGEIIYTDDLNNVRTTWFCRKGSHGNLKLTPEQDPDYESAD